MRCAFPIDPPAGIAGAGRIRHHYNRQASDAIRRLTVARKPFIFCSRRHDGLCHLTAPGGHSGTRIALGMTDSALIAFAADTPDAVGTLSHQLLQECAYMRHRSPLLNSTVIPRAILAGRVRAAAPDVAAMIAEIRAAQTTQFSVFEDTLNQHALQFAALGLNGGGNGSVAPSDPTYSAAFASYARGGGEDVVATLRSANAMGERGAIQAAMSEGDSSSGGYLAPVEWDRRIQQSQRALSPMRRISQVVTTGRSAYSTLWSNDMWGSGWVGETADRPATTTPGFSPLVIPAGEIYANPAATQRLLDDSAIDIEKWLATGFSDEFSRQEGIAFVSGNGVNKPMGFLQFVPGGAGDFGVDNAQGGSDNKQAHPGGNLSITVSGAAASIPNTDVLVDLKYGLGAPYRQNATWLMNSQTAAVIAKMKDGQGNFIWRETLLASEPSTLLGRPVEIDENMPNIAAGLMPIAFGDFARGYLVNDRIGVRILRDPFTNKPFVTFYGTKRVGGGLLDPRAIRVLKIVAAA